MAKTSLNEQIQQRSLWRLMLQLALPGIIGMSVNAFNAFMDALYAGQLIGSDAVAAISLAFPALMITGGTASMIGQGAASVLSRALGSRKVEEQERVVGHVALLSLIFSAILTLPGVILADDFIAFMGGEGEVLRLGTIYLRILLAATLIRMFAVTLNMLIRAEGRIREAMIFAASAALLNIALNPLFIHTFGLGIAGAAYSTVLSAAVYAGLDLFYFLRNRASYPALGKFFSYRISLVRDIIGVGIAAFSLQVMFFVQQATTFKSLSAVGDGFDQAFMGAIYRIYVLAIVPVFGFVQAMQPVVGINYGAGLYERVRKALLVFSFGSTVFIGVIWVILELFPRAVLLALLPDSTFSDHDVAVFRWVMVILPLQPIFFAGVTFLQSLGDGRIATWLTLARQVIVFIPITLGLVFWFGRDGAFFALPVTDILMSATMILVLYLFVRKKLERS